MNKIVVYKVTIHYDFVHYGGSNDIILKSWNIIY